MCIRALISPVGMGPPAPSMTASALSAAWDSAVTPGDCGDELLGLAADDLELADHARGEPRRAGVLVFECVRFGWTRRGGALAGEATFPSAADGAQVRPPRRFRCGAARPRRRYSRVAAEALHRLVHGAPGAVVLHAVPDDQKSLLFPLSLHEAATSVPCQPDDWSPRYLDFKYLSLSQEDS